MDEQLPVIHELWDPVVAEATRSRLRPRLAQPADDPALKQVFKKVVMDAYEDLGGYARFVEEMNRNYLYFVKHGLRPYLPQVEEKASVDVNITIRPGVPPSPLDGEFYEVPESDITQKPLQQGIHPWAQISKEQSHADTEQG